MSCKQYIIATSIIVSLTAPLCGVNDRINAPLTKEQLQFFQQLCSSSGHTDINTKNTRAGHAQRPAASSTQQDDDDLDDIYA